MSHKLAIRGDTGLYLSVDNYGQLKLIDQSKTCKAFSFDNQGNRLAWSDGKVVKVLNIASGDVKELPAERTQFLQWSPKDTFLATWEVFAVRNGKQEPNVRLWTAEGDKKASFLQRKSDGWAPRWGRDEDLVAVRTPNNEVAFYKDNNFDTVVSKLSLAKMDSFSVSPSCSHVVAFVPGQKGAPGFAKLFAFPNFNPEKDVIAFKSFMLADKMEAMWSNDSKNVLLLMQSEVDKTGASYYGKSQLHFMDVTGETAFVQMSKEGPIYNVAWAPKVSNFCVVYGFMPAKATLFNKKCEKVFDFGTGPRNLALFNPQGNLLMLGGFGNLRGNIEIWNVEQKKKVSSFEAPDSTNVSWGPDGQHILTTTCAPRLRMGNGFKIWHYTTTLMHETFYKDPTNLGPGEELWEVNWRPDLTATQQTFNILDKPIQGGIKPKQPQASKQAYVPPNARGKVNKASTKLHDEDELPENLKGKNEAENMSKSAAKNKKRREAAKKKKEEEASANNASSAANSEKAVNEVKSTGDPEKDKKIRKINDKLAQIAKLKDQVKAGKQLEANQLDKIKKESEFLAELKSLQI